MIQSALPDRSAAHARRTSGTHAAFFLPYLSRGMSVLDVGCGPGTITIGLADVVSPGEVVGVDNNETVLARAEKARLSAGTPNLRFELGDATNLPFPDSSFDAVFIHAVLQHLGEPHRAVREARRVLKPGGVLGLRDADHDGSLIFPQEPDLLRSLTVMTQLRERRGTSPRVGKRLRALLADAGFEDVIGSAVASCDATPERTSIAARDMLSYWRSDAFRQQVHGAGLATPGEVELFVQAWTDWSHHPGAFWVRLWCEAVGRLPQNKGARRC